MKSISKVQTKLPVSGLGLKLLTEDRHSVDILPSSPSSNRYGRRCRLGRRTADRRAAKSLPPPVPSEKPPGAEGVVERVGTEGAGVERPGDEFPEGIEVAETEPLLRIVVVRGAIVHVGGEPHDVLDSLALDETQDVGDLEFAARAPAVAVGAILLEAGRPAGSMPSPTCKPSGMSAAITFHVALRLPQIASSARRSVRCPRNAVSGPGAGCRLKLLRAAVAAHVEHEDVEQRAVGNVAIDALGSRRR